MTFNDDDKGQKFGGRYGGPGRIVGDVIEMENDYRLYCVAMKVAGGYGEFVHVFPETALEKDDGEGA